MKICLVNPSCALDEGRDLYTNDVAAALYNMSPFKKISLGIPLALPTLAAHTPPGHDVSIIDEEIEALDFDQPVDLVGITAMSYKATRAYEIARAFKQRGVLVIIGGIHVSMCPEEALEHVDSVVIGEAEEIWPEVIADAERRQLRKIYKSADFPELSAARIPRYDLVRNRHYGYSYLQTSRGCPYNCKFCTVTRQNGRKVRKKSPAQVIAELDALLKLKPKKEYVFHDMKDGRHKRYVGNIAFIDDNFTIDRAHALAVCEALKRYQEENNCVFGWYTQVNVDIGFDEELLQALADANCWHVFIGLESIDPDILKRMNKKMNLPERYGEALRNIQHHGIIVFASIIIGEEGTTWEKVYALQRFIEENDLLHILVNILTPYPGTELYDHLARENRLITTNPQKYNIRNVVFKPRNVAKEHLEEMYIWLCRTVFNHRAAYRRGKPLMVWARRYHLPRWLRFPAFAGFFLTLGILMLRGKVKPATAFWGFYMMPYLVLINGSYFGIELLAMIMDYEDFVFQEEKRFLTNSAGLCSKDRLVSMPGPVGGPIHFRRHPFRTLYLDSAELSRYGFTITRENQRRPVLLLGGTSIPVADRMGFIQSIVEGGYEVATIENPLGGPFSIHIHPATERPSALEDFMAYLQSDRGVREVTIVAQSYAAFETVRVLLKDPLKFKDFVRCIILINPPGFDENISAAKHLIRFFWGHILRGYARPRSSHPDPVGYRKKERAGILAWAAKSLFNTVRGMRETRDIVGLKIKAPLKELVAHGYRICFFLQSGDQVVPAAITLKHARELVPPDDIQFVEGGHNDLFFQEWQRRVFIDFFSQKTHLPSTTE